MMYSQTRLYRTLRDHENLFVITEFDCITTVTNAYFSLIYPLTIQKMFRILQNWSCACCNYIKKNLFFLDDDQWRSQKFGLGGAVKQFWLESLINIENLYIKG